MHLVNAIEKILTQNRNHQHLYTRNLIKEYLQDLTLQFIYNHPTYNSLIFTGGTCLKKVYGLNRLSEDLDFDYIGDISFPQFADDIKSYFSSTLQYSDITTKISSQENTVFLKFPLLKKLPQFFSGTPEDLFLRCDLSPETTRIYSTENNQITAGEFTFFVTNYDLPTMFANKIAAFHTRSFFKGKHQKLPFKGRDVFDLYWFSQLSSKQSYNLKPHAQRLSLLLNNQDPAQIKTDILTKLDKLDDQFISQDLSPLIADKQYLQNFIKAYKSSISKAINYVI